MSIIKLGNEWLSAWDIPAASQEGDRISVSFKVGKRRKLKTMRIVSMYSGNCEYCGHYSSITLKHSKFPGGSATMDNHFGPSTISLATLLNK